MGSGKGLNIDLPLIMRCLALLFCAVAVGLNLSVTMPDESSRPNLVSNSMIYSTGGYLIVLTIFLGWTIAKNEVDKKFAAIILICGCLWNVGSGIGVIAFSCDYKSSYFEVIDTEQMVGGIVALIAGVVMLADGVHNLGYF